MILGSYISNIMIFRLTVSPSLARVLSDSTMILGDPAYFLKVYFSITVPIIQTRHLVCVAVKVKDFRRRTTAGFPPCISNKKTRTLRKESGF
jgi:hypothetical protein